MSNALATHGILTREQVAICLGVTTETLTRWEDEHDFPARSVGRTTLYDVDEIKRWIAKRPRKAGKAA